MTLAAGPLRRRRRGDRPGRRRAGRVRARRAARRDRRGRADGGEEGLGAGHHRRRARASPDRLIPPCPSRRAGCGGCGWQHLTVEAQRSARVDIVADALRRTGGIAEPVVELGGGVEPTGYRTTVRVAATADGRAGFRAEQTHDVVAAPDCLVAHPTLAALLPELRLDPGVEPTLRVSVATGELAARWDHAAGEVHGLPDGHGDRLAGDAARGRRRPPPARVDGLVLPVRAAGGRAARRRRAASGAGARRRRDSSSTPTPASACSPCAPRIRRHGSSPSRRRDRRVADAAHNLADRDARDRSRRGRRLARRRRTRRSTS